MSKHRGIYKDSARRMTCNLVEPPFRVGKVETRKAKGSTLEGTISQAKNLECHL
jgi:hypothetical protein